MSVFLKLNKVTGYRHDPYSEDPTEGLPAEPEPTVPVTINVSSIKSYYPRKHGRVGTRINFIGSQGFAVSETVEKFEALLAELGSAFAGEHVIPTAEIIPMPQRESADGSAET